LHKSGITKFSSPAGIFISEIEPQKISISQIQRSDEAKLQHKGKSTLHEIKNIECNETNSSETAICMDC
jgi:hypothetical protein